MYDLHTHTVYSDGVLIPAESARRAMAAGYAGIAFTDHADASNLVSIIEAQLAFKESFNGHAAGFAVIVGVELTHVLPSQIGDMVEKARNAGADIVTVHGETIVEPVAPGTNDAAIEAGVDFLAHPGLVSRDLVERAARTGVYLEITTRKGHSLTNGHVAALARSAGAGLVVNNDFHAPGDAVSREQAIRILRGAGLSTAEAETALENTKTIFTRIHGGMTI